MVVSVFGCWLDKWTDSARNTEPGDEWTSQQPVKEDEKWEIPES